MKKSFPLAALALILAFSPALAGKKGKSQDSVNFDPVKYSCAAYSKMIDSQKKGDEEMAGVALMWGYGFLSAMEYAVSKQPPQALTDKVLAILVIEYASVCRKYPKLNFFEATLKMAEEPAPPSQPSQPSQQNPPGSGASGI